MNISMERDVVHKDLIIITSGVFNSLLQLSPLIMAQYIFTVVRVRVASRLDVDLDNQHFLVRCTPLCPQ